MARKKYNYNFIRKQSKGGRSAIVMAGVSFGLFLLDAVLSFVFGGAGGAVLGAVGLFAMLLAVYGFYLGMKSFSEEQVSHRRSIVGSVSCGIIAVGWLALYLVGVG